MATFELEHAIGFSGYVPESLYMHPNGSEIVYAAAGSVVIGDVKDPHNQVFLHGHDAPITCLALSASGSRIASGQSGDNSDVLVWDVAKRQLLFRLAEHVRGVAAIAFSDDERLLVTVGGPRDNKLVVWDLSSGYIVAACPIQPHHGPVASVRFGGFVKDIKRRNTQRYLMASAGENGVVLWYLNPHTGEVETHKLQTGTVVRSWSSVRFSPDGEYLFVGTASGDFGMFFMKNLALLSVTPACTQGVQAICVLDASQLVVGGGDGTLTLFQAHERGWISSLRAQLAGPISCIHPSSDASQLLVGTRTSDMFRVLRSTLAHVRLSQSHCGSVTDVAYPPGVSDRFATCSSDGSCRVWDANDYSVQVERQYRGVGTPLCIKYVGEMVVSAWTDGHVRTFDALNGDVLWELQASKHAVTALQVSRNNKFIVTGSANGELRVWETKTREMVSHLREHRLEITSIQLFSDNSHCISSSRDRSFILWDLKEEKRIASFSLRSGPVLGLALYADNARLVVAGQSLALWDIAARQATQIITGPHIDEATCVAMSHGGGFFATGGSHDHMVKLWDAASGVLLTEGKGHSGKVTSVQFSPDDKQLVSVGEDGNIFVWNVYDDASLNAS